MKTKASMAAGAQEMMMMSGEAPRMFKIGEPTDQIKAFRVSKDAVIAAVVLGNDEIHIYKVKTKCLIIIYFIAFRCQGRVSR